MKIDERILIRDINNEIYEKICMLSTIDTINYLKRSFVDRVDLYTATIEGKKDFYLCGSIPLDKLLNMNPDEVTIDDLDFMIVRVNKKVNKTIGQINKNDAVLLDTFTAVSVYGITISSKVMNKHDEITVYDNKYEYYIDKSSNNYLRIVIFNY